MNFAKIKKSPFNIISESPNNTCLNACLSNNSYLMELKKPNCVSKVEIPNYEFLDHIIEAKIRIDSPAGYTSAGLLFRITDDTSYYMALVSSQGYFRFDVINDNVPKSLIAWTEISDFDGMNINLNIITYGTYLIFIVNGKWIGETCDDSISSGRLGFAVESYADSEEIEEQGGSGFTCKAMLDYLVIDTRIRAIEENYKKWTDDSNINADCRLRLADSLTDMGEYSKALDQINKAWKRRDEAIRSVTPTYTEVRTKKELILASRLSFALGQYLEADEYINAILDLLADDPVKLANSVEIKEAVNEKIIVLNELGKFKELKEFALKYSDIINKDLNFYKTLARCHWRLNEYEASAAAWDMAFKMNNENGGYAVNAANALELAEKKEEALARFMEAGKIFLNQDNMPELTAMIPKLSILGGKSWEARALAGKWAFSMEDYNRCEKEFTDAEKLRCALKPKPKADPAIYYLWGLVLNLKKKNTNAINMLKKAVKLAPDYGLFRFKLAEIRILNGEKGGEFAKEFRLALDQIGDDPEGKMANHAGTLLQKMGDKKNAKYFIERAKK